MRSGTDRWKMSFGFVGLTNYDSKPGRDGLLRRSRRTGGDEVEHPAKRTTSADPEARGENQPQNACENSTIVDLADARKN